MLRLSSSRPCMATCRRAPLGSTWVEVTRSCMPPSCQAGERSQRLSRPLLRLGAWCTRSVGGSCTCPRVSSHCSECLPPWVGLFRRSQCKSETNSMAHCWGQDYQGPAFQYPASVVLSAAVYMDVMAAQYVKVLNRFICCLSWSASANREAIIRDRTDIRGRRQRLSCAVGIFPFRTHMTEKGMKMGYVEVSTQKPCSLFPAEETVRGHVYHFSEILQVLLVSFTLFSWLHEGIRS